MSGGNGKTQSVPHRYAEDWLDHLDQRTRVARALRERCDSLARDLGGWDSLSYQRRSLIRRAIHLEALIEQSEAALARGETVETGQWVQATNALQGLLKTLGLERKARDVPDLHSYLRGKEAS